MRYFFVNYSGEEIELRLESKGEDVTVFVELDEDVELISWERFVRDVIYELSITDATPEIAVLSVTRHYDNTYAPWDYDGELSLESAGHFKDYCNEQCGTSLTIGQACSILWYGV